MSVALDDNFGLMPPNEQFDDNGFDDFDAQGVEADKIGSGSPEVDKPGWYHFMIEAKARPHACWDDDLTKSRKPDILLLCTVLVSAPNQSPEGSLYKHELVLGGKGQGVPLESYDKEKTLNFLVGVGILKKVNGEVIDPETGTTRLNVRTLTQRLNRLQFIGHLKLTKSRDPQYPDKIELPWGRGAYQLTDVVVKDVPKHADYAALVLGPAPAATGTNPRHQPPSAAPAAVPSTPAAAVNAAANPLLSGDM